MEETDLSRRAFIGYLGAGVAISSFSGCANLFPESKAFSKPLSTPWSKPNHKPVWKAINYPLPLGVDGLSDPKSRFVIEDRLVVPEGFSYETIVSWGDVLGPSDRSRQIRVGYNADYVGFVPVRGGSVDDYWMIVNHEYVSSLPWTQSFEEVRGYRLPDVRFAADPYDDDEEKGFIVVRGVSLGGPSFDPSKRDRYPSLTAEMEDDLRCLADETLDEIGVSIVRVKVDASRGLSVVRNAQDHKRITAVRSYNIAKDPGNMQMTGPCEPYLPRPVGTVANCGGGTTPWGTFLTCEENYQEIVREWVDEEGIPRSRSDAFRGYSAHKQSGLPRQWLGLSAVASEEIEPRTCGWVTEIDPNSGALKKHSALGRFRHENVAVKADAGKPLVAYMGDDRRGGHIWKFVSEKIIRDPEDPANSKFFEEGTLFVAQFNPDYSGKWIALKPETPLVRPNPDLYPSEHLLLPLRPGGGPVAVGAEGSEVS